MRQKATNALPREDTQKTPASFLALDSNKGRCSDLLLWSGKLGKERKYAAASLATTRLFLPLFIMEGEKERREDMFMYQWGEVIVLYLLFTK